MKKMMPKHFVVLCLYKGSGDEMLLSLPSFSLALAAWNFFYAVLSGTSPLQEDIQASPSSIQKMEKYVRSSMRFNISQGSVVDETRCLKRSDLITTLADALPPGTIQFGRQAVSVKLDPSNSYPTVQLHDGSSIVAKILIGCDGAHSVVADFLELKPTKEFGLSVTRGLTHYSNGHSVPHEIVRVTKNNVVIGRTPIDDKSAYWFVAQPFTSEEHAKISQRQELIRESTLHAVEGFSTEFVQLIEDSELESLTLTHLRYRHPCDLLLGKFRKGTVTVAGDAMHVMGPFLGQGGAAGLEDAIVLARCLSQKFVSTADRPVTSESQTMTKVIMRGVEEAMDRYVKERRMRVVRLSTQSYLTGLLFAPSSRSVKSACNVSMAVLFRNPSNHSQYDCGVL